MPRRPPPRGARRLTTETFQLLWHEVRITTEDGPASVRVDRLIQRAHHDFRPQATIEIGIRRSAGGCRIFDRGDWLADVADDDGVLDVVFTRVYRRALELAALKGWLRVHGATVRVGPDRVVILGPPGAGKTTLAVALLCAGEVVEGDESFLTRAGEVVAVPRRFHVKPGTFGLVPAASRFLSSPAVGDLRVVDPTDYGFPWRIGVGRPEAVVFLRRTDGPSTVQPLTSAAAAREILAEAFPVVEARRDMVREAAALAAAGPAVVVHNGPDHRAAGILRSRPWRRV